MSSTELIAVFAVVMLGIALVAVAVDWLGKPIRRRFVPRMYRFPHELPKKVDPTRTAWSDTEFVIPASPTPGEPHRYSDGSTEWSDAAFVVPEPSPTMAPSPADLPVTVAVDDLPPPPIDIDELEPTGEHPPVSPTASTIERAAGWRPGQYIYNLLDDGAEPDADMVAARFWQNIAATEHADVFGAGNRERMGAGMGPLRRNPRTRAIEVMFLPVTSYEESHGKAPTPRWPDNEPDPFART